MTSKSIGVLLVVLAMAVESGAQLALKIGAVGGSATLAATRAGRLGRRLGLSAAAWIALGVACYSVEIILYTLALHRLDVSTAFPLGSLCFVGVALLSKWLLGEAVGRNRWLGIGCILAGTVCLAL